MDGENKRRVIAELCDSLKLKMEESIRLMPEHWDGNELRLLAADIMLNHASRVSLTVKRRYQHEAAEYGIFG